jgi:CMP-N-acetylneuraminic acid synthetase
MHSNSIGLPIPKWRVVDIDNLQDWRRAELLFKVLKINGKN